ncbi:ATPase/histidine kinase/DNA gyrase B/HSP90 domain protein [Marvinbryantia formatexigens DSM 14469]|uniref:ATPase/histidine kinase/DNA gyrase B/HSP90 domain protein n=1 Tax=Marvinbryantia formatexigens DSM 14469 TaxID=478749 RepID=C6LII7_9FIRM|nr:sensor histidine kinase [Marvinbryantia formatexigens]EET59569.1 ATPase/histidine kinase/DNA gyrase B/HSP90 domain protein [Marvinbryantia formatexigens DSM 14469]UWO26315.1 sensor histidine kinase [Marvinbryantia formatexigens DSM 14469]SDG08014.1 Histidine kinase-, DNA gyrase B-, and HSP90-like ATPase [Marvinbryantia formatexigens]
MKQYFRKFAGCTKKLRTQLFLTYFLVFALFFLAVILLVSVSIRNILIGQIGNNRTAVLRQIAERANIVKTSSTTLSNLYSYEILSNNFLSGEMTKEQRQEAWDYLDAQKQVYDEVFSYIGLGYEVVLLGENGFLYNSDSDGTDVSTWVYQPWYKKLLEALDNGAAGEVQFSRTFSGSRNGDTVYRFAAGQRLDNGENQSVLLILIDEQLLEDLYVSTQEQGGEIYIYDQAGFIVSHSNKKMLGKQFINVDYMRDVYGTDRSNIIEKMGETYMLSTYLDEKTGWTIVEESPTRIILGALNKTWWIMSCLLIAGLLLAVAVSAYISRHVSNPLANLSSAMDKVGKNDFKPPAIKNGIEEINHLQESFQHMAYEISNLMDIIQEREEQKRELEVNFLRAQINPHFLYNTLFSIRCAVEVGKNNQAAQMISAFIDLLRSTLAVRDSMIPLCDEFEATRKYLVVQKLRYGEKINYELELQEGTEQCMVLPLILQPLAENAIFHGIEAKYETGTVVIESALLGERLLLTITDDGAGMDERTLEKVRACLKQPAVKDDSSIGMPNVHNRIRLNYGEEYGLTVESSKGIGTTVTLLMPAIFQKEEKHESSGRG